MAAVLLMYNVGTPWSEASSGVAFGNWWRGEFPSVAPPLPDGSAGGQQDEWVCGISGRGGVDGSRKPFSAISEAAVQATYGKKAKQPPGGGITKLVARRVPAQFATDSFVIVGLRCFGIFALEGDMLITPVSRDNPRRAAPSSLAQQFTNLVDNVRVQQRLLQHLRRMRDDPDTAHRDKRAKPGLQAFVATMTSGSDSADAASRPSTCWSPAAGVRLEGPEDVLTSGCVCTQGVKFPDWLYVSCPGGAFVLTPNTHLTPPSAIPAMMHSLKFQILSLCRTCPVPPSGILRGVISSDALDTLRVASDAQSFESWHSASGPAAEDNEAWDATEKHKVMWIAPLSILLEAAGLAGASEYNKGKGKGEGEGKGKGGKGKEGKSKSEKGKGKEVPGHATCAQHVAQNRSALEIWSRGTLHLVVSAPRSMFGRWRMRFAPSVPETFAGQVVAILLDWVGNKVFHYECLRRAMADPKTLSPLRGMLFGEPPVPGSNRLHGILHPDLLDTFERKRGFTLDLEQRQAMAAMNASHAPVFHVHALAGVGKTALLHAVLHCLAAYYYGVEEADSAALLLLPSRELREDLVLELMSGGVFQQDEVLWMGRPPTDASQIGLWDDRLGERLKEMQADVYTELTALKRRFSAAIEVVNEWCPWPAWDLVQGCLTQQCGDEYVVALQVAKDFLQQHIQIEVEQIIMPYNGLVADLGRTVKVIVSTADAWAKFVARCMSGPAAGVVRSKTIRVAIFDELQAYEVDQVLACCSSVGLETAIFSGDQNQLIVNSFPKWTRTPWVSLEAEVKITTRRWDEEITVEECDTLDTETALVPGAGGGTGSGASGSSGSNDPAALRNPETRWWVDFLTRSRAPVELQLTWCKRFGEEVCSFLREFLPEFCAKLRASPIAPATRLKHTFYTGEWRSQADCESGACAQRTPQKLLPVWKQLPLRKEAQACWNELLFAGLARAVHQDLLQAKADGLTSDTDQPVVLVICYLHRVATPLREFLKDVLRSGEVAALHAPFTDKHVKVVLVDSARGLTAHFSHVVRARRMCDQPDQYLGIQADLRREYVAYTRGRLRTHVWLEVEPFGAPGERRDRFKEADKRKRGQDVAIRRNTILSSSDGKYEWVVLEGRWWQDAFGSEWAPGQMWELWGAVKWAVESHDSTKLVEKRTATWQENQNVIQVIESLVAGGGLVAAPLEEVREAGIGARHMNAPMELEDPRMEVRFGFQVAVQLGAKICDALVADASPDTEMVTLAVPILQQCRGLRDVGTGAAEPMLRAFIQLVHRLYTKITLPEDMERQANEQVRCQAFTHKAELAQIEGHRWWSKACRSDREASAIVDPMMAVRRQKRVYCYLGGGSLSEGSTEDSGCIVVRCKCWNGVAAAVAAIAIITAAVPGPTVRLRRRFVTATVENAAVERNLYEDEGDALVAAVGDIGQELVDRCDAALVTAAAALEVPVDMLINDSMKEVERAVSNFHQLREVLGKHPWDMEELRL